MRVATLTLLVSLFLPSVAQAEGFPIHAVIGVGATYTPRLTYDTDPYAGALGSVIGEANVGRIAGRLQLDVALPATFTGAQADNLRSGAAVVGSGGYRLGAKVGTGPALDLLGTVGFAWLTYEANSAEFAAVSPQFGATVVPRFGITDRLAVSASLRHLFGADGGDFEAIGRTDLGVGLHVRVF